MTEPETADHLQRASVEWNGADSADGQELLQAHLPGADGWSGDRIALVAPPGVPLTLERNEETFGWRLMIVESGAGHDHPFALDWIRSYPAAELVRKYPELADYVRETGRTRILRLRASVVRPGDVAIDEERARRIHAEIDRLRRQLAEAFPKIDWAKVGAEKPSAAGRVVARLRRSTVEDFTNPPPASGVPLRELDGLGAGDLEELAASLRPPVERRSKSRR